MDLLFFGEDFDCCDFFLLGLDEGGEDELEVVDELCGDVLVGFLVAGAFSDGVVVEEGEIPKVKLSISAHC